MNIAIGHAQLDNWREGSLYSSSQPVIAVFLSLCPATLSIHTNDATITVASHMTYYILPPNPSVHYPAILETSCVFTFTGTELLVHERVLIVNTTVNQDKLVSYPVPIFKTWEGVWQHIIHCRVQKEFNQLLNHVLMFTHTVINGGECHYIPACSSTSM